MLVIKIADLYGTFFNIFFQMHFFNIQKNFITAVSSTFKNKKKPNWNNTTTTVSLTGKV
jgi:hypothetical protein